MLLQRASAQLIAKNNAIPHTVQALTHSASNTNHLPYESCWEEQHTQACGND